jgi:hypothetical protein
MTRHVAYPDLGLRHVEQRVPVRPAQFDERHQEREREDDEQRGEEQRSRSPDAGVGRELLGVDNGVGCDVVDHGRAFITRSNPGRTGD